jgi:methionine aminopeptidase
VGRTTDDIDAVVHSLTIENNAYPSPLNYRGFPKSVCTSVNNVACHGIPDDRPLEDGDIINVDVTVSLIVNKNELFSSLYLHHELELKLSPTYIVFTHIISPTVLI